MHDRWIIANPEELAQSICTHHLVGNKVATICDLRAGSAPAGTSRPQNNRLKNVLVCTATMQTEHCKMHTWLTSVSPTVNRSGPYRRSKPSSSVALRGDKRCRINNSGVHILP